MQRAKQLQQRIDELRGEIAHIAEHRPSNYGSPVEVAHRQVEISVAASQIAELTTRRIVWLTWALVILTAGLLAYTILLYQDARANAHHRNLTQHHELEQAKPPP